MDIHRYLQTYPMLPELREVLLQALAWDNERCATLDYSAIIPQLAESFGVKASVVAPFQIAWRLMYLSTSLLDHIQDGDPIQAPWLNGRTAAEQQTIVLALYTYATSLLNKQRSTGIPDDRVIALYQQWHSAMLRMASGQYRDLRGRAADRYEEALQHYQEAAQAKTGTAFSLALGGTALLCTSDEATIEVLQISGEIFGLLLQMSDDLGDAHDQPNQAPTFPHAHTFQQSGVVDAQDRDTAHFAAFAYQAYYSHIASLLGDVPASARETVLSFVTEVFQRR